MKKMAILGVLLAVLSVAAGLLWPDRVLALRERQLYGQIVAETVAVSSFVGEETTLAQRLLAISGNGTSAPVIDFSVGAHVYGDEYALRRQFLQELKTFSEYFTPAFSLQTWLEENRLATADFHNMPVNYRCAVDPNTGKAFLMGTMQDLDWSHFLLYIDMESGKIIGGEFLTDGQEIEEEQYWLLACGLANYLGLDLITCLEEYAYGGLYLLESITGEQVCYAIFADELMCSLYPCS